MKLNEFKKPKLNEIDLSSFIGDYGSAAVRTGLGSLGGNNVLSTDDQMVKDQFIKNFTSRAFSGLQSGISSGLIDPSASSNPSAVTKPVTTTANPPIANPKVTPVTTPVTVPVAGANAFGQMANQLTTPKQSPEAGANAFGQMANQLATTKKSPEQIRQEKQAAAAGIAQDQMANNGPFSKLPANQASIQAGNMAKNVRQQKQATATQTAQDQMSQNGQFSKLPADQFNTTAANIRQQKQGVATQTAQDQMSPMSKLPTDQFNKTSTNARQQKQVSATRTAQDQMSPMSKLPTDQFNKTSTNARQQKQVSATRTAQDQMSPMSKLPTDQYNKSAANVRQKKQADAMKPVTKAKNNVKDFPIKKKKSNSGSQAFGQMAQNLGDKQSNFSEGSKFDKLNFLFENILSEATRSKQSISQYITNFFTQFMKGVTISDKAVVSRLKSLAKELEQTYNKDKGKSVLPKLADLAWAVQHAQSEEKPKPTPTKPTPTVPSKVSPQAAQASTQQAKMTAAQITKLMQGLSTRQKQSILKSLQTELASAPAKNTTSTGDTGGTYNKKTGAAKLGGKSMVAATDLPPNIQKQIPKQ